MRDKSGRKSDFEGFIQEELRVLPDYLANENNKKFEDYRLRAIHRAIMDINLDIASAYYSGGGSKEKVKEHLLECIRVFESHFKWIPGKTVYQSMIDPIALAILTDIDLNDFKRITKVIERDRVQDKLLDYLIKFKQPDWQGNSDGFIQKEPYEAISKAIDETNSESGIKLIQNYLSPKVWYHGHRDSGWHNAHTNKNLNTYFGYWSWEAAALVKAKGWDDEKLKNSDYYPYDAVHW